jgi:hypothetical protein
MGRYHAYDSEHRTFSSVDDDLTAGKYSIIYTTDLPEAKAPIILNMGDEQTQFVHMCNEQDMGRPLA